MAQLRTPAILPSLLLLLSLPVTASAIGFMFSGVGGRGDLMEIVSVAATVRIDDRLAVTRVDQVFRNQTERQVEGVYEFVLPPGAVITDLVLWIGDKRIQGLIMEKEEARRVYDDIVARQIDPALVEQVSDERFRLSVFPFPAQGTRRVELEYMQVLEASAGLSAYVFPLALETQEPVSVGTFQLRAEVRAQVAFDLATTPEFAAATRVERGADSMATVTFADEQVATTRDFEVRLQETGDTAVPRVLSYPPTEAGGDGWYALWLPPAAALVSAAPVDRAVTFAVDISSSMRGDKIDAVKQALRQVLTELGPEDLFNVVVFSSFAEAFRAELVPATADNIAAAADFVRLQGALGATNFQAAFEQALGVPAPARVHHLVFLTDGRPTIGEQSPLALDELVTGLADGVRVYTIGVGDDVNRAFLRALAEDHLGESAFVADDAEMAARLRALFAEFSRPVLVVTDVEFVGTQVLATVPERVELLKSGEELFQVGRYTAGGPVTVRVRGHVLDEALELSWPVTLAVDDTSLAVVSRLWAQRMVTTLEGLIARLGPNQELSDDILHLGLTYRLVTSRTSLFAPDPEVALNPPLAGPEGCADCSGASAVTEEAEVQTWLGKTFVRQDGVWIDATYRPGMERVPYLEDGRGPAELARFAAMGEPMIVVLAGRAWEIPARPARPVLAGNAPNPFNAATVITYYVPAVATANPVVLTIHDLVGQVVWRRQVPETAGEHRVRWDGRDLEGRPAASGIYLYRLTAGQHVESRRMTLLR